MRPVPRWVMLAVAIVATACSTPPLDPGGHTGTSVTPRDRELCSMLCAKQQECVGLEVDAAGIERCGAQCFENISSQPALALRVRATVSCLSEKCGADYDRCTREAESALRSRARTDRTGEAPLTKDECRVVCQKTLQCLGASERSRSIDGCVLGCEVGSRNPEDVQRYRAVLRCRARPCGVPFQECIASR